MWDSINLLFKRLALSSDEKKEIRTELKNCINDYRDINTINVALNAQKFADNLKVLGDVQLHNKDIIYFDDKLNRICVRSTFDESN